MRILNGEISGFAGFLMDMKLAGRESRMRTRFVKILHDRMKQTDQERLDLIQQYSEKDAFGNPVIVIDDLTQQQRYELSPDKMAEFSSEYSILINEEFVIIHTPENNEMLVTVRDLVLNSDGEFSGQEAMIYERYCEIVEQIQ